MFFRQFLSGASNVYDSSEMKQRDAAIQSAAHGEFADALRNYAPAFRLSLTDEQIARLETYFQLVNKWNERLHLVAPCTPDEFASRHIAESLLALEYISPASRVVDIGSGAGLPALPCLIARPDYELKMIEATTKKAIFLREALRANGLMDIAEVINERFETLAPAQGDVLTCRALDRFVALLPKILDWSKQIPTLLLYGGPTIAAALEKSRVAFTPHLIPRSEQRYIFIVRKK